MFYSFLIAFVMLVLAAGVSMSIMAATLSIMKRSIGVKRIITVVGDPIEKKSLPSDSKLVNSQIVNGHLVHTYEAHMFTDEAWKRYDREQFKNIFN